MSTYLGACLGKYRIDWKKDRGTSDSKRDINFPLLRYSDILLMYAEALNELNNGPTTEAVDALKQVRLRAFGKDESKIGAIPSDYEGFKNAIILERKLELSNEGLRKTDLTRWGILVEHLTAEKERLYQLARREGEYADVDVYRAYKKVTASLPNEYISVPYMPMSKEAVGTLDLSLEEDSVLNRLNNSSQGHLVRTFYEEKGSGKVYITRASVPEGANVTEEEYVILNMFGCHSVKQKGGLSVDKVEGLADKNTWIEEMFYGLKKNMVEIIPFNTTSIIDVNPGLAGQQHPCYQ